ncbi:nuclear transport factor 2 family protein [Acidiphilium acidophilum]|uniref:nuclear transport factor 2 family protein n=1 Tax=Acidiphilium acidophilum TaxID=76588 RepID=UPI002E8E69F3|nr:nuclear transport factor 2 family protein [Acidiphilium acidophilum]
MADTMISSVEERRYLELLKSFADAWNRHDIDALMTCVTDDCVFETVSGSEVFGTRYQGHDAVRLAFIQAWETFPDAQWVDGRHFVCGDRGVSEWMFRGTTLDGIRTVANGCDLFTFKGGKIAVKNAFRKNRPPLAAR